MPTKTSFSARRQFILRKLNYRLADRSAPHGIGRVAYLVPLALLCILVSARAQETIQVPSGQPTVQAGIDAANDGDTVLVAPGKYFENLDFHGKAVTLLSSGGASATIIDGGLVNPVVSLGTQSNAPAVLDGFTIQRGAPVPAQIYSELGGGVIVVGSATVQNNTVTENESCGIDVATFGIITVKANHVFKNGFVTTRGPAAGCYIDGAGIDVALAISTNFPMSATVTITDNLVENNAGAGIQGDFEDQDMAILANQVHDNDGAGISVFSLFGPGIIADNLIYENLFAGISAEYNAPSTLSILNNTLYQNGGPPSNNAADSTELRLSGGNIEVVNNLVVHPVAGVEPALRCTEDFASPLPVVFDHNDIYPAVSNLTNIGCLTTGFGNRSEDPLFTNTVVNNFHLLAGSPEIDSGNNSASRLPVADLDGNERVQDRKDIGYPVVDMGAYEASGTPRSAPTIAVLTPCSVTPQIGTDLLLTASITSPLGVPTGPVSLFMDLANSPLATAQIDSIGRATFTVPTIAAGLHSFVVSYSGTTPFTAATSVVLYIVAQASPSACAQPADTTATTLTSSLNPSPYGQPVTFTASVNNTSSTSGSPTGSVVFSDGPTVIANQPLSQTGLATNTTSFSTATLTPGSHKIIATYGPTGNFSASSVSLTQTITSLASTTTLASSLNPAPYGQAVTFTATVIGPLTRSEPPTGTITFTAGTSVTVTQPLTSNGGSASASFSISTLPIGAESITATYNPSVDFSTSKASLTETINVLATSTTLTASPNPSYPGQTVTLLATVSSANPSHDSNGTVRFFDGNTAIGESSLRTDGSAALSISTLAVGTHILSASYLGGGTLGASQSNPVQEVVMDSSFTLALNPPTITLQAQHHTSFSIEVAPIHLFFGVVRLDCGSLPTHATCRISPQSVTLTASGSKQTASVYLDTSEVIGYAGNGSVPLSQQTHKIVFAVLFFPFLSGCFLAAGRRHLRQLGRVILLSAVYFAVAFGSVGCSGKYPASVAPGSYTLHFTGIADDPAVAQTVTLQLTVSP